jgi:N-succinyldiaminopimelate aminotransferase
MMAFPERFSNLPEYPFPRLRALLDSHAPGGEPVDMTIGEPRHPFPDFVGRLVSENIAGFAKYPPNDGSPELLAAIALWIERRYGVALDPAQQIMALNGTREGLFNAMLALCPESKNDKRPGVLLPNPFYQVYDVATRAIGAEPILLNAVRNPPLRREETEFPGVAHPIDFLPDFSRVRPEIWNRTAVVWMCSPSNPQGAVADISYWKKLLQLAEEHDFKVFADECYSEIYRSTPPTGALEALGPSGCDPERLVVFNSLSKRSNVPGLRSGFVAGAPETLRHIKRLRAFAGAPLPLPLQRAAEALWTDEAHVEASRALYGEKYRLADTILGEVPGYTPPEAGFFLWLPVDDGEQAALRLWQETGVRVLPGAYLARDNKTLNPGRRYIRAAMVAAPDEVERGLTRIRECLYG